MMRDAMREARGLTPSYVIKRVFMKNTSYEGAVTARLASIHGDIFWDIGANVGFYTFQLRKNFRKIIAVEPNPQTAYVLRRRIKFSLARNIEVKQLALSDNRGWTYLYSNQRQGLGIDIVAGIGNRSSSDSLLPRFEYRSARDPSGGSDRVHRDRRSIPVQMERFDDVSTGLVDLIKIDVEGAEFRVLEGMRKSLEARLVRNIVVELHNRDLKPELESVLLGYGYHIRWIDLEHLMARFDDEGSEE